MQVSGTWFVENYIHTYVHRPMELRVVTHRFAIFIDIFLYYYQLSPLYTNTIHMTPEITSHVLQHPGNNNNNQRE